MALTKVSLINDGVIVVGHLHTNHGITTDHIGEGSQKYYSDTLVQNFLTTNNYVTSSDVANSLSTGAYFTSVSHDTVGRSLTFTKSDGATDSVNLTQYIDDTNLARLVSGTINSSTGIATFTRDDSSTFTVDFSALLDDTNDYVTSAAFDTSNGILTLTRFGGGTVGVDLDGRYLQSFTETDPTVPSHVKAITTTNISNWNTAYGWGNHAGLYASASHTHSYLPLSGGTITGTLTIDTGSSSSDALVVRGDSPTISFIDNNSSGSDDFYIHVNSNNFYVLRDTAGADIVGTGWDSPHPLQLEGDTNNAFVFGNTIIHSGNISSYALTSFDITTQTDGKYLRSNADDSFTAEYLDIDGGTLRFKRDNGFAHQRADARLDGSDQSRLHWYGKDDGDATRNFKHAWYDGSDYIDVTAASGSITFDKRTDTANIITDGSFRAPIFYDSNDTSRYLDPQSESHLNAITSYGVTRHRFKNHYFGLSTDWDSVGFTKQTNVHFQGHNQFWVGAGNGTWFTGTANSKSATSGLSADASRAHDLLITTMQSTSTYDRGITFGVDNGGNGNSGWRLGKWHSGTGYGSSKLTVDGGLFVKGGYTDEFEYYADDYSTYHGSQGGVSYWTGGTNVPSITASTAIQIQSGNKDTNTRNPQLQFHQYGYGGVQFRYDGPNDRMYFEPLGTNRLDWTRFQTDSGYIDFGPANTGHAHIYTDRANFYFNKQLTVSGGSQINQNDIRSKIFYDIDNTGYYFHGDATTNLNALTVNGTFTVVNGTINMNNNDGFVYDDGANVMKVRYDGTDHVIWTAANDGPGSGLDADTVDGLSGSYLNHRNYNDTDNFLGGYYTSGGTEKPNSSVFGAGKLKIAMLRNTNLGFSGSWNDVLWISTYNGGDVKRSSALVFSKYDSTSVYIVKQNYDASDWGTGYLFWNSGNDGSGSGLDADLLDGIQGSSFLRSDAADTFSGTLSWGGAGGATGIDMNNGDIAGLNWLRWDDDGEGLIYPGGESLYWSGSFWNFSGGYVQAQGSMRTPIFYDSDNTSYYTNPASTSRMNQIDANYLDVVAGAAYALRFWNSTNYSIRMSESSDGTYGGRVSGETTSDYNMYFTMTAGTNRGFVFNNGLNNAIAGIDANGIGRFTGAVKTPFVEINKTSTYGTGLDLTFSGSSSSGMLIRNNTGSTKAAISFYYSSAPQGARGTIMVSSTSTAYNTSSDYRLKENLVEITDGIERVKLLQPKRFNFIGDDVTVDGFVAHETQEVVPESITGVKDEVDEEGNPVYQGIDQAKLVPLLTAALQEAIAKIEDLESRLQAIENQ